MNKKIFFLITCLFFCFLINCLSVKAVLCNIGLSDNSPKGYGSISASGTTIDVGQSATTYLIHTDSNGNTEIKKSGYSGITDFWDTTRKFDILVAAKSKKGHESYISNYNFKFYDDDNKQLCEINNKNGGIGLNKKDNYMTFHFNLTSGHVSYFIVEYNYSYDGEFSDTNSKKIHIRKKLGDTGSVTNVAPPTPSTTSKTASVKGWYICSGSCTLKNKGESLKGCKETSYYSNSTCIDGLTNAKTTKPIKDIPIITETTQETGATVKTYITGTESGPDAGTLKGGSRRIITDENGNVISGEGTSCTKVQDIIHIYWKWVMITVPVLLIVLMSIDFFKAMVSNDADAIKKAVTNVVKRTIAAVVLLALPALLSFVFGLFGLPLCI